MRPENEKNSSSSSDEEEDDRSSEEEEDEETEAGAVRRVPPRESSSEDEDEDEDDGDEEQEEESEEPSTVKAQRKPLSDPQHKPMDTSTKAVHGKNAASSKKRPSDENQVVDSAKRKKASNQITTEEKEASSVQKQSFQRVWSIEDEKNLISSFHEFIQKKLGSRTDTAAFFNFWEERGGKFSKKQVKDKLRRLKEKYSTGQKMEQRGGSKGFATSLERDIYTISKEIWGSKEDEKTGKGEKKGKRNHGSSNEEGNKEKREENKGRAEESNSKKKKKEKAKSEKTEILSPKRSGVGVAEEGGSKEEKKEKSDSNKKEPCAPQGSPKSKVGDEEAKPPRDTKILDEKPNAGGESVDSNSMESWRILVKPPTKLVGLYEVVEKGVISSTKLKMSELEVTRRKLEKMRSEIDAELMELTFERANLALEVMRAVQSACEKAKEQ